ncbi:SRPBCC family protein [Blastococcus brunescens]|uniref:SRPBCC family protein n=1 Tax=Blastococcus brunescens TaxID=1564165 RepID=A0ABZ1AUL1_9ACTN|nr:SRPBCC family protein [Blastococcus sp. BMG 8361]WRL62242.1 SRPBCC family protein [Blastococcus sp. BMG 8361]
MLPLRDDPSRADRRAAGVQPRLRRAVLRRARGGVRGVRQRLHRRRRRRLPALPGIDPDRDRRYYAATIKPAVFLNLVPDHVILLRMTPLAVDRTVIECDWLYAPEVVAAGLDVSRSVELFHRVNQQDFAACERTQPGMSSRAYAAGGVLVPVEHHLALFHDWLRGRLGEG